MELADGPLADMLFGAAVGRILIDTMPTGERPDMAAIHASIEQVVGALFNGAG